ncbi:MAG: hypothetical protein AAF773_03800 [Cyanobacteria bacterium P01_D01_bin.115]
MLLENPVNAFDTTAVETYYEPDPADIVGDIYIEAQDDVEAGTVDQPRVAKCPTYRSAVLTAFEFKVKELQRHIGFYQTAHYGQQPNGPTHAWGYVDSSAGNSSWAADAHDIF